MWGAKQLVSTPPVPLSAVVNLDCLGFEPELFALRTGHEASTNWLTKLAAIVINKHGIDIRWIAGGDDSVAFVQKGIPASGITSYPASS